jgi:hypothetical protein
MFTRDATISKIEKNVLCAHPQIQSIKLFLYSRSMLFGIIDFDKPNNIGELFFFLED